MEGKVLRDVYLSTDGMGIILYSDEIGKKYKNGDDVFKLLNYENPKQVASHIQKGDIVGFCTGSSGEYIIKFREGYPNHDVKEKYPISIFMGIVVSGGSINVIDLFDMFEWETCCAEEQKVYVEDGAYEMILCTRQPKSGIYGDNQEIYIYLNKVDKMPKVSWTTVPQLYK